MDTKTLLIIVVGVAWILAGVGAAVIFGRMAHRDDKHHHRS